LISKAREGYPMKSYNQAVASLIIMAFLVCTPFAGQALSTPISITNPSFEEHNPWTGTDGHGLWNSSVVGWNESGLNGPETGGTATFLDDLHFTRSNIPDGDNVAYSWGGIISQVLSDTLLSNHTYELKCYIGRMKDTWPFPRYAVQLLAGGDVLVQENSLSPALGQFLLSTLTYTSSFFDVHIGQPLEIRLINFENFDITQKQLIFDHVTLNASPTVVPLPSSIFLIGSGFILLPFRKKIRR
jgi:hypothetical protein